MRALIGASCKQRTLYLPDVSLQDMPLQGSMYISIVLHGEGTVGANRTYIDRRLAKP